MEKDKLIEKIVKEVTEIAKREFAKTTIEIDPIVTSSWIGGFVSGYIYKTIENLPKEN